MRVVLVGFAMTVLTIALWSEASIYQMVVNTYKVTLVAAFIPLVAGLYWKRATSRGARWAIVAGLTSWIALECFGSPTAVWPPQLVGFLAAGAGMIAGSLWCPTKASRSGVRSLFPGGQGDAVPSSVRTGRGIHLVIQGEAYEATDLFDREGLLNDLLRVEECDAVRKFPGCRFAGYAHDFGVQEFSRQRERDRHSVLLRHQDIGDHQIGRMLSIHREACLSVVGFADFMAVLFQDAAQEDSNRCVIVND